MNTCLVHTYNWHHSLYMQMHASFFYLHAQVLELHIQLGQTSNERSCLFNIYVKIRLHEIYIPCFKNWEASRAFKGWLLLFYEDNLVHIINVETVGGDANEIIFIKVLCTNRWLSNASTCDYIIIVLHIINTLFSFKCIGFIAQPLKDFSHDNHKFLGKKNGPHVRLLLLTTWKL